MKKSQVPSAIQKLFVEALKCYRRAYAPYSDFPVGAAFYSNKKIFSGCNVENTSYGATICAEQTAIVKAISEGHRKIENLLVITRTKNGIPPCALCLQVLSEFADGDLKIWLANPEGIKAQIQLRDILPTPFLKKSLSESKAIAHKKKSKRKKSK